MTHYNCGHSYSKYYREGKIDSDQDTVYYFCNFIYFSWRLITLQYCSGLCHTLTWISHSCTCVLPSWTLLPPPSPSRPSGLSQCTDLIALFHALHLDWSCFTYGNIYVSMLFSPIMPPLPSPTESKSLFFTSVSFAVLHIGSSLPSF